MHKKLDLHNSLRSGLKNDLEKMYVFSKGGRMKEGSDTTKDLTDSISFVSCHDNKN